MYRALRAPAVLLAAWGGAASAQETVPAGVVPLAGKSVEAELPVAWRPLVERLASKKPSPDAPVYRLKVWILPSVTLVRRDEAGLRRMDAASLNTDAALKRVAAMAVTLQAAAGTRARVLVEAEVDDDPRVLQRAAGEPVAPGPWIHRYLSPLVNHGGYEAEDRQFRGPYHQAIVLLSGASGTGHVSVKGATSFAAGPDELTPRALAMLKRRLGAPAEGAQEIVPGVPDFETADAAAWAGAMRPETTDRAEQEVPGSLEVPAEAEEAAQATADAPQALRVRLVEWLKHADQQVRLNAAYAFTRVKEPRAITHLADAAVTYSMAHGEAALEALAFQDTELAWAAVRHLLRTGPTEHNKAVAAKLLAAKRTEAANGEISVLLTSRSWQARLAAAEAIGSYRSSEAQTMNLVFLQEIHPAVRLAVTVAADPKLDLVARRLNWAAVNDASDEVRAWSYIRLTQAGEEKFRKEGLKGVRDDSVWVRIQVVKHLLAHPAESHRDALRLAVLDANPEVRTAALEAWAEHPGEVKAEDLGPIWDDKDPAVSQALAKLVEKKGVRRP